MELLVEFFSSDVAMVITFATVFIGGIILKIWQEGGN